MRFLPSLSTLRERLTRLGTDEPLSRLSLFFIVLLDIFVLFTLFQWIGSVGSQVTRVDQKFSYVCQGFYFAESDVASRYSQVASYSQDSWHPIIDESGKSHAACIELERAISWLFANSAFLSARESIELAEKNIATAQYRIDELESSYDTTLLEKIADQRPEDSISPTTADTIRADMEAQDVVIKTSEQQLNSLKSSIAALPEWTTLWNLVDSRRAEARSALDRAEFWYPVILLLAQLAFLLPVLLIAGVWHGYALSKRSELVILLSAHLLVVATLPIFIKIVEMVLDILPRRLLVSVLDFLRRYDLVVLFNYVLIIVAILATIGIVYFIQRKWFNLERTQAKRLESGACPTCAKRLPQDFGVVRHCPFCGESQIAACAACGAETKRYASHCCHCGESSKSL